MIIVTGAAGFIGSNIVKQLNDSGRNDVLAVDNLKNGSKFLNLVDLSIMDYMGKEDFLNYIQSGKKFPQPVEAIIHNGACSSTTEWDGRYMMENNYDYSKALLYYCIEHNCAFLYASSAAIYGANKTFKENPQYESPLNVYGYSKLLFDQLVRREMIHAKIQIVGFRYFNVYGPREQHKGTMSSVSFHANTQLLEKGEIKLFEGCDGYENGEQRRDFVYVGDVANVNLWFLDNPQVSGIFNLGTGRSQSFNDVARAVQKYHQRGEIVYIPFPDHLKGRYQSYTEADVSALQKAGYTKPFNTVEEGVQSYMEWLNK